MADSFKMYDTFVATTGLPDPNGATFDTLESPHLLAPVDIAKVRQNISTYNLYTPDHVNEDSYCKTSLGVDPSALASPFVVTLLRMCRVALRHVMSLLDVTEQDSDMSNNTERLISSPSDPNSDDTERLILSNLPSYSFTWNSSRSLPYC